MANNAKIIWDYFKSKGFTNEGIAGILGNLQAESNLQPNNLQNSYNKILKMTDEQYTEAVDKNTYKKFVSDGAGYGLAQWTYSSLKKELYDLCKTKNTSISDINSQLECLYNQLKSHQILNEIKNATSITEASNTFLIKFERPQNQSDTVKQERIDLGKNFYNQFMGKVSTTMRYSNNNKPIICMATQSPCYKQGAKMIVKGVLWHSTGAENKTLKRYVQPSPDDPNRDKLLTLIGKNPNGNSENRPSSQIGLNAWIGTLADNSIAAVQTMPWDYTPWGCGGGTRGSCNEGWIQFEICEDSLTDKTYFDKVYKEACELTAYLCSLYNLNPKGVVDFKGIKVPVILCHQDAANLQLGTNHADVLHWFKRYNKTMNDVREDVFNLMEITPTSAVIPQQNQKDSNCLQLGDINDSVKTLQQSLIKLGYDCGPDGADGDFGPNTQKAVKEFQKDQNLLVNGIADIQTLLALDKMISSSNMTQEKELYRVRKSWNNAKSQIGAFTNLENAKKACDKAGKEYYVFNAKGKKVYPDNTINQTTPIKITPARTYNGVVIGSASHDENGAYRGGLAGDQNHTEVHTQNWYDGGWDTVLRPTDPMLAEKIAAANENACDNSAIGYDMNQRNTIYTEALKVNLDLSKISTPCECDCSSLVSTCCICAGLPKELYYINNNLCTTWTLAEACQKTGKFQILKDTKYLRSKDYLKCGDILLNTNQHVVIVLSDGPKAETNEEYTPIVSNVPYIVKINTQKLNVRTGPGTNYPIKTYVYYNYKFTIIEEKAGWGKLKSGAGWIALEFTVKV